MSEEEKEVTTAIDLDELEKAMLNKNLELKEPIKVPTPKKEDLKLDKKELKKEIKIFENDETSKANNLTVIPKNQKTILMMGSILFLILGIGLIGSFLVFTLAFNNKSFSTNVTVYNSAPSIPISNNVNVTYIDPPITINQNNATTINNINNTIVVTKEALEYLHNITN